MTRLILREVARWGRALRAPFAAFSILLTVALLPSDVAPDAAERALGAVWQTAMLASVAWLLTSTTLTALQTVRERRAFERLQDLVVRSGLPDHTVLCILRTAWSTPAGKRVDAVDVRTGTLVDLWLTESNLTDGSYALVKRRAGALILVDVMPRDLLVAAERHARADGLRRLARIGRSDRRAATQVIREAESLLEDGRPHRKSEPRPGGVRWVRHLARRKHRGSAQNLEPMSRRLGERFLVSVQLPDLGWRRAPGRCPCTSGLRSSPSAREWSVTDGPVKEDCVMATAQSPEDLTAILGNLVGEEIAQLQVLGINSLKSIAPSPADLAGRRVTTTAAADRVVTIEAGNLRAQIDLERAGRLVWLDHATPARVGDPSFPTLRLLLASGAALDFREPAKTKRISVKISPA